MKLVIVESPAKAKTINKYLGPDYKVIASYGHVRDLPSKDGSVNPDDGFSMIWEVSDRSKHHIDAIVKESKAANEILLATDPDREGEAISWHVRNIINDKGIKNKPIQRIVFHEITKTAISNAIKSPRDLDQPLIEAYLARRALDYLVGFTISPVLWRKLPGSRSAGRVQSVALRLIADREIEIEEFKPQEFWTIEALFKNEKGDSFPAKLTVLSGEKLDKFSINSALLAEAAVSLVKNCQYKVENIEKKTVKRNPWPPFITSTLQQEASRKLGFSTKRTMQLAQSLYEGVNIDGETIGLITYMRTDSVNLANDAIAGIRDMIGRDFGDKYLPKSPRKFQSKVKNAQEAHEAVRPTDISLNPAQLQNKLDRDIWRLYDLIWKRTAACQMQEALIDQVIVDISDVEGKHVFRAVGSVIAFDGFLRLYKEENDDDKSDEEEFMLPPLQQNDRVIIEKLDNKQHFTQSPPRYTEASLVKKLEELGIGRPSTYANIIQVLQDRSYVRLDKKRFFPEERGMIVNVFLSNYFTRYIEYDFTAGLEQRLDDISNARISRINVLSDFWNDFIKVVEASKNLRVSEVLDFIEQKLSNHLFPVKDGEDREKSRVCPSCGKGRINLKLGRFGAFLGCSLYPNCSFTRALYDTASTPDGEGAVKEIVKYEPKILGKDSKTGEDITLRKGPYGFYVQLGEAVKEAKKGKSAAKVKRVAVSPKLDPEQVSLSQARIIVNQPHVLGTHPDDGKEVSTGVGRFGPYIKHDNRYFSLNYPQLFTISSIDQALDIISEALKKVKNKKS